MVHISYLDTLISIGLALLPLTVAYLIVKIFMDPLIDRLARRAGVSTATASFWKTMVLVLALSIAAIMALSQAGARIYIEFLYILIGLAILSIVLGSRDVVANTIAGYAILIHKPFKRGDVIALGDTVGTVRDIGTLYTQIVSERGVLYVPNTEFLKKAILNRQAPTLSRVTVPVKVRPSEDLNRVEQALLRAARGFKELTVPPEPEVVVNDIRGDYCELHLNVYITNPKRSAYVASELRKRIKEEFEREGIALY
ncbi:hypothetical protein B6U99_02820 [Candidatus Geothermarchaeota archaeon ex4572_27]|nr:MAG: hypothetical protein B6U99_02820 [Candidatus Geothermarchaeota archaeon ex4572_27]